MPISPKPQGKEHVVTRRLADGTLKQYRYDRNRPSAPRLRAAADPDSMRALAEAWQHSPEWRGLRPATQASYRHYLDDLAPFAAEPVAQASRRLLLQRRNDIALARGNGAAMCFMRTAGAMFAWGVEMGWIDHTPLTRIKALPGGTLKAWTVAQADLAERLLAADGSPLAEAIRRVILLGRHTGQRRGDLVALRWNALQVGYGGPVIRLVQQKTGRSLAIPVQPRLADELDAWKAGATSVFVLTNAQGRPWGASHLSHQMRFMLEKIGLPDDLNVHGLRKLKATELADAGCSAHEIAAITGHTTLKMVEHYTRNADQARLARSATARLGNGFVK